MGRPRTAISDSELREICETVREEAYDRRAFGSREAAFLTAVSKFDRHTRGLNKAARRLAGGGSYQGDVTSNGERVLEALIDFNGRPVDVAIIAAYQGMGQNSVRKGIERLRACGIIEGDKNSIRWERFGAGHFDAEFSEHVLVTWTSLPSELDYGGGDCARVDGSYIFLRIAGFGGADLSLENLAYLTGQDTDETANVVNILRNHGLIYADRLEVDRDRYERLNRSVVSS